MAPHTAGGLAHGMAYGDHIRHKNYKFTSIKGPAPTSAYSHDPNLHLGDLGPVAHGRHILGTALRCSILESTYIGGMFPH
jgi:hypothetical protein